MPTVHAIDLHDEKTRFGDAKLIVAFGDEPLLRQLALARILHETLGDEDIPHKQVDGSECEWRDVHDELATRSLFDGARAVLVNDADSFVTQYRDRLEKLAKSPLPGTLILAVAKWPVNTKLYKLVDKNQMQINCAAPKRGKGVDRARVAEWMVARSHREHQATLPGNAARLLLDLSGVDFGLLDQNLAKLALFAGVDGKITPEMVRDVVGGWQTKTIWDLLEAAADGNGGEAVQQLDRLLEAGETPIGLLAQIAWSLRRFATAVSLMDRAQREGTRPRLSEILEQAGFRNWPTGAMANAERQIRRIGRRRAGALHRMLLQADLDLKGSHSAPNRARFVLEQLLLTISC